MGSIQDILKRGTEGDIVTNITRQTVSGDPTLVLLAGVHFDSLGIRVIRSDPAGRLLVSTSVTNFDILNIVLLDGMSNVIIGTPTFRRVQFYALNANGNVQFQKLDGTFTGIITVAPNLPITIEGVFLNAQAQNTTPGVPSTLQIIVGSDSTLGA